MSSLHLVYALQTTDPRYLQSFYASHRLNEEASNLGIDFSMELASAFDERLQTGKISTAGYSKLLIRGDYSIDSMVTLENQGFTVINPAKAHALCLDKLATAHWLKANSWPCPHTAQYTDEAMPIPAVLKPRYGKMGKGIVHIEKPEQLFEPSVQEALSRHEYLVQEYVSASYGKDIRFFFADFGSSYTVAFESHCSALCVLRQGSSFLSNAHAGGKMERYVPTDSLSTLAYAIFKASGLVYGTVDFLFTDTAGMGFTVCELNSMPGFEELERATKANAARAIVRSCLHFLERTSSFSPKNML